MLKRWEGGNNQTCKIYVGRIAMNKFLIMLFILLTLPVDSIYSQSKLSFFGLGEINYIPMKEFSNYYANYPDANFDKVSFGAKAGFNYRMVDNHYISLTVEYLSSNASFSAPFVSVKWIFETIPFTLGYEYHFNDVTNGFIPLIGVGISYSIFENEYKYSADDGRTIKNFTDNSWGFEVKFGVIKNLIQSLFLMSEIRYRYSGDFSLNSFNDFDEVNLSGIGLNLGVLIKII